jgi:hypothetical protein
MNLTVELHLSKQFLVQDNTRGFVLLMPHPLARKKKCAKDSMLVEIIPACTGLLQQLPAKVEEFQIPEGTVSTKSIRIYCCEGRF